MPDLCGDCVCIHPKERHPHTEYHQCTKYKVRLYHFRFHPDLVRAPMCVAPEFKQGAARKEVGPTEEKSIYHVDYGKCRA